MPSSILHPLAIAHRGASAREVENSLAAFRAADALRADAVELDIHATADGALVVRRLGAQRPAVPRGVLSASYPVHPARMMEDADAQALWQHAPLIDADLVLKVHEAGGAVYAWTVDTPELMQSLLALGVDGLC